MNHRPPRPNKTSAASGKAGVTLTAPGRPDTQRPNASISEMPKPKPNHWSGQCSSPNGMARTLNAADGITQSPITGMARRLPATA
jgi:hypothetical protein